LFKNLASILLKILWNYS